MEKVTIKKMPSKQVLEEYLAGGHDNHPVTVYFDTEKGEFIRSNHKTSNKK